MTPAPCGAGVPPSDVCPLRLLRLESDVRNHPSPQDDGCPPQPGVGRQLLDHELSDIGARDLAAVDAGEVGGGPDAATRWAVGEHGGADDNPVERTGADRAFLAVLVLIGGAEQQRLEYPVEDESAVVATVADAERGDAD